MDATQQISKFQEFFEDNYHAEILELIRKGNNFIIVDFVKLLNYDPDLSTFLLDYPDELIKAAEIAIEKFDLPSTMKNFKVRFINLPESQNIMISNIRSNHIDKFLVVEGVVRQKSDVRPQVTTARFECPSCGNVISVIQLEKAFKEPNKCGCGRKGKFRLLSKEFVDAQGVVLEEASEDLEGGEQPKRMNIFLSRDLVSPLSEKKTNPGSRIRVAGVLKEVPVELRSGAKATRFDLIIESNSVEAVQEDFYDIRISEEEEKRIIELAKDSKCVQKLIQSVAPSIYGYEKIKEALIFQLVGGNRKKRADGAVTRGDMHILLIGDPGAAKSQLLKRIALVAPKARYVSGKGVSGAGLTASVVKDEMMGGWALEAGALVLSNKGFCLSGDTKIWDSTGRLLSIKEIYDGFKRKRKISIKHFDEKKLRLKDSKIKQVSRRTAQNLLEITFANQDSLKITPEHKIAVWDNGVYWKEAKDLKQSDYAITCLDWKLDRTKVSKKEIYLFELLGLIVTDGSLSSKKYVIRYYTKSDYLKSRFKFLVKEVFSKECGEYLDKRSDVWQLYFCSKKHHAAIKDYGIPAGNKSIKKYHLTKILGYSNEYIKAFLIGYINGDGSISNKRSGGAIDIVAKNKCTAHEIRDMFRKIGILAYVHKVNARGGGVVKKGPYEQYRITITGTFNFQKIKDKRIAPEKYENLEKILKREDQSFVIPKVNVLISQLNTKLKRNDKRCIYRFTKISELKKGRGITRSNLKKILSCLKGIKKANLSQEFKILTRLVNNYICPVKVKSISELGQDTVYNIQVDDAVNQNYFANFLLVHNCMIDEMDKMTPEDRSAMHEALEQQTVSISKANIQATLRCETTVLAAANPKFGRFDPYGIIAEQINLPPALINRFDLIFAIKDIPEIEKDNKIAGHILKLHQDPDVIEPELDTDFLKKYISYVRQKIKPKLTEGAIEELQKYYVEMRNSGTEDGGIKAVPISPRQLEALVRLSEASAKIRLGTKVSRKDAKKGIELLHFSLSEIGIDPETGKIDIDRITTGISSSQRSHIIIVKEIINTLEKKSDNKPIPVDDIITEAEIKGIAGDIVEDTLEKLKRSGDIYEPRTGFFKKMG